MRERSMKKSIQALWDRICDPKLKLPLGITVVCLSLVLAGLVLFSRRGAYTVRVTAETAWGVQSAPLVLQITF